MLFWSVFELLGVPDKMPRQPGCGQNRPDARKADEAIPRAVWPGSLTGQMGGFRRTAKGPFACRRPPSFHSSSMAWSRSAFSVAHFTLRAIICRKGKPAMRPKEPVAAMGSTASAIMASHIK